MHADTLETTDDAILNGKLRLLQPRRGHRFGHDAILLAAAVPAEFGQRVAEFGAGVGAASLALLSRAREIDATLIEIDESLCALATQNIARNGFAGRARAIRCDVTAPMTEMAEAGIAPASFDHVFMNPPFNDPSLQASPHVGKRAAHAASSDLLERWVAGASLLLNATGALTLIWRADALSDVLNTLQARFGALTVTPVYPAPGRPAIRIIVSARKGSRAPLSILPALTLNDAQQKPSAEAEAILRHGAALLPPD